MMVNQEYRILRILRVAHYSSLKITEVGDTKKHSKLLKFDGKNHNSAKIKKK